MKLPSLQQILQGSIETVTRFPIVLANSILGTIAAVLLVDHEGPSQGTILFQILYAAVLGIPLLFSCSLMAERLRWNFLKSTLLQLFGILCLIAYAMTIPLNLVGAPEYIPMRLAALAIGFHLLVSVAPFIVRQSLNGFWQFNKLLLYQLLLALLYAVILYAGLSLALAALDNLFGLEVPGKRYGELWIIINGIILTWFFLSGVPRDIDRLESLTDYPKPLRIFAQYVLLPMLIIYSIILYAYLAKILITWNWPEGWVGRLILGFAALIFGTFVLLFPLRQTAENRWIPKAMRWFQLLLLPQLIIFFPALWRRISEYGMTESRYLGLLLGAWITVMVIYFLISKKENITLLPLSLGVIALLISFGPWGMFELSGRSQVERLRKVLTDNSILADGTIRKATEKIAFHDTKQISSILDYLAMMHGYARIQPWFSESLLSIAQESQSWYKEPSEVASLLGVSYIQTWYENNGARTMLTAKEGAAIEISGYDYLFRLDRVGTSFGKKQMTSNLLSYRLSDDLTSITLQRRKADGTNDSLRVDFAEFFTLCARQSLDASGKAYSPEQLTLEQSQPGFKVKFAFRQVQLTDLDSAVKPSWFDLDILFSFR